MPPPPLHRLLFLAFSSTTKFPPMCSSLMTTMYISNVSIFGGAKVTVLVEVKVAISGKTTSCNNNASTRRLAKWRNCGCVLDNKEERFLERCWHCCDNNAWNQSRQRVPESKIGMWLHVQR